MGGGKSHGLIGLWHLARSPSGLRKTEVGRQTWEAAEAVAGVGVIEEDLRSPQIVVLSCDNMTPDHPDPDIDGPAKTLGERFLWRLFGEDNSLYKRYRADTGNKARLAEAIGAIGRPVLVLVDEVLDYLRSVTAAGENPTAVADMAFLRALLEVVAGSRDCVLVMVMISSDVDVVAMSEFGETCRSELEALLTRTARPTTVTSGGDFAEIIRKRLFVTQPTPELLDAATADFALEVRRSYPFHPAMMQLAEKEWSRHAGFQKVRSTIQIFAAAVFALQQRALGKAWVPELIGPGDIPLSSRDAREALLGSGIVEDQKTVASFREIAINDVVADDDNRGNARLADLSRDASLFAESNPRIAERIATALFVFSLAPRAQGHRGATEFELKSAGFVPDPSCSVGEVEAVLEELKSPDTGLAALDEIAGKGGQERRFVLSTRMTLNMFYRAQRAAVGDEDRDRCLAGVAEDLASSGPFHKVIWVDADDLMNLERNLSAEDLIGRMGGAGVDDARQNRLVVLDPRVFTLANGQDEQIRVAVTAALGLGANRLSLGWASSCVFALANTQRRGSARNHAANLLAWQRVGEIDAVRSDDDLKEKARDEVRDASRRLEQSVRTAFQHVVFLAEESDGNGRGRAARFIRFERENQSSLDGAVVWAALAEMDKVFQPEEFDAKALLHNMSEEDWGRPLSELRDAFFNAPRLPLLPSGEEELRRAVYQAYAEGLLVVVDAQGSERAAQRPGDINIGQSGLSLRRPASAEAVEVPMLVGLVYDDARSLCESLGFELAGQSGGLVATQDPEQGESLPPGSTIAVTTKREREDAEEIQVSISLAGLSIRDESVRDLARLLFDLLGERVEEDASHLQATIRIVVPPNKAAELVDRARELGATVDTTDL